MAPAAALIPARLASTRLARKLLLADTGRPLLAHTAENVRATGLFERVIVATDAPEIEAALAPLVSRGIECVRTRADHQSGTSRIAEAAQRLGLADYRVLVDVQGDEPEIARASLARLLELFGDPAVEVATLATPLNDPADLAKPQVVKVVLDRAGDALYFSRAPIPYSQGHPSGRAAPALRHLGVYAFRPAALARCAALPPGALERAENLEQLRWLEAEQRIRVALVEQDSLGIDTREDYDAFVRRTLGRAGSGT
jgi:3-deoxy-manno-octulosonate cytidylyltransferase (CMP-KDO synthetase)